MKIKSLLLASSAVLFGAVSAQAADAVVYEEPVAIVEAAPVFSWTGAYIGGQVGYGWGRSEYRAEGGSLRFKPDGFLGGLYAGYNFDVGNNFILGIDGDITYNDLEDGLSEYVAGENITVGINSKLRWSGAIRARVGVGMDRWMPYVAGGVAFGNIKNTISGTDGVDYVSISDSKTLTGWTIGGGVDYAATDNLIVRLEYRYTDYGNKDFDATALNLEINNKFKTHDIRLGVAYKF